jgi:hypothetical protein
VPTHEWPIDPISVLHEKYNPRNINHMPAVNFFVRRNTDQICRIPDGHERTIVRVPMNKKLKEKTFCKWEKSDIKKNLEKIYELTSDPKYVCEKCARVSKLEANVCKPHKFASAAHHPKTS